jgi:hypothetical protein
MKHYRWLMALVVGALFLAACGGMQAAVPDAEIDLLRRPTGGTVFTWDGRGADSQKCHLADGELRDSETGWTHWVFATKGSSTDASLVIKVGGEEVDGSPFSPDEPLNADVWHFYTPYFDLDDLEATITLAAARRVPGVAWSSRTTARPKSHSRSTRCCRE